MESFFKAHSVKKESSNPRNTTRLKNRFKLMMRGYNQNDNSAIRTATELPSCGDDSDVDIDLAVQDDSDFELVNAAHEPSSSSSERSDGDSPASSSNYSPVRSSTTSPACDTNPTAPPLSSPDYPSIIPSRVSSSYVSLEESKDVSEMMDTINGILNSESDESELDHSFAEVSDFDSPVHEMDTYVPVNSSTELSNTSSSFSEFDANGQLASCILEKMEEASIAKSIKNIHATSNVKQRKDITVKMLQKALPNETKCWDMSSGVLPKVQSKKIKNVNEARKTTVKPYISLDASKHYFSGPPNLFRDFTSAPSSQASRIFYINEKPSDLFSAKDLKNAQIYECSGDSSDMYDLCRVDDAYAQRVPPEDRGQVLNFSSPSEIEDSSSLSETEEFVKCNGILNNDDSIQIDPDFSESNNVEFLYLRHGCVLILRHPSQIYIQGKVKATALCGASDVMGYRLTNSSTEIFAPRFSYALNIKTVAETTSQFGLFGKLTSLGLSVADTEDTVVSLKEHDSVIYLEDLRDIKLDFVEKELHADVFRNSNKIFTEQFPLAAETLSCTLSTDKPCKSFEENPIWPEIVTFGSGTHSKGIVCGGKGTGKSTFLKYYINKMLRNGPILLIDLDPGQSELTVAGNVSVTVVNNPLIGPNFTHLQKPHRMLNVGLINVDDKMERYMNAVSQVLQYATTHDEYRDLPWLINTMGMSNALGLKIISYIILLVKPTFVVQIDSDMKKKCFGTLLNTQEIKRLSLEDYREDPMFENVKGSDDLLFKYFMSSPKLAGQESSLTAKEERYLSFLSYFSQVLTKTNKSLLGTRPYVLHLQSLKIATNCITTDDSIKSVINAKIVALCEENSGNEAQMFTLKNSLICHGHGVVRAVDKENGLLYIITPERQETLAKVNVLLYSDAHPDLVLSSEALPDRTCIPFRTVMRLSSRQLMKAPKRRFNPLPHLLRMKRLGNKL